MDNLQCNKNVPQSIASKAWSQRIKTEINRQNMPNPTKNNETKHEE